MEAYSDISGCDDEVNIECSLCVGHWVLKMQWRAKATCEVWVRNKTRKCYPNCFVVLNESQPGSNGFFVSSP